MLKYSELAKYAGAQEVGSPYAGLPEDRTAAHPGVNLLAGLGTGLAAGGLSYMFLGDKDSGDELDKKQKRRNKAKRILAAAGIGLGTGLATTVAMTLSDSFRGANYTHEYKLPDPNDKKNKDIFIHFVGGGGGAQIGNSPTNAALDISATSLRNGSRKTYLINPNDQYYAQDLLEKIYKANPDAVIHIAGHSHGGAAAYRLARFAEKAGIPVARLDTVDPVAWLTPMSGKPGTTERWNNYRVDKYPVGIVATLASLLKGEKPKPLHVGNFWAVVGNTKGKLDGSVDHVFSSETSDFGNHSDMRWVRYDFGDKPYDVTAKKPQIILDMEKIHRDAIKAELDSKKQKR